MARKRTQSTRLPPRIERKISHLVGYDVKLRRLSQRICTNSFQTTYAYAHRSLIVPSGSLLAQEYIGFMTKYQLRPILTMVQSSYDLIHRHVRRSRLTAQYGDYGTMRRGLLSTQESIVTYAHYGYIYNYSCPLYSHRSSGWSIN